MFMLDVDTYTNERNAENVCLFDGYGRASKLLFDKK